MCFFGEASGPKSDFFFKGKIFYFFPLKKKSDFGPDASPKKHISCMAIMPKVEEVTLLGVCELAPAPINTPRTTVPKSDAQ